MDNDNIMKLDNKAIWEIASRIAIGITAFFLTIVYAQHQAAVEAITHLQIEQEKVRATRFTKEDGLRLRQEILDRPPPKWLIDRLDSIQQSLKEIKEISK